MMKVVFSESFYIHIDRSDIEHTSYRVGEDFVYFYRLPNGGTTEEKEKELFFTYLGMLRYLLISRNPNAKVFRKWVSKILLPCRWGRWNRKNPSEQNSLVSLLRLSPSSLGRVVSETFPLHTVKTQN
jgi:hypothetical protein